MPKEITITGTRVIVELSMDSYLCKIKVYPNNMEDIGLILSKLNIYFNSLRANGITGFVDDLVEFIDSNIEESLASIDPAHIRWGENFDILSKDTVLTQLEFSKKVLLEPGILEKDLVVSDLLHNDCISAYTLICSDAFALVRKAIKWEDKWDPYM